MFEGRHCRYLSLTQDNMIGRSMGSMDAETWVTDMRFDAAKPEHLRALAQQILFQARRVTVKEYRRRWKDLWRVVVADAEAAEARLAANPSPATHPGFFSNRSVGRPGMLWDDLHLPYVFRLDLTGMVRDSVTVGCYEPPLRHDAVYRTGGYRDGRVHLHPTSGLGPAIPCEMMRGLLNLGRLVALPLSAMPRAAA